jgi:DNA-binding MarR family transcriptional regulator
MSAQDHLDKVLLQWRREMPEIDARPLAVVGRILRLASLIEQRTNATLLEYDLALWEFDVLATLRRNGKPYSMTPKELMAATMLSSGAMTNRIDRLQERGYVARTPSKEDRRSLHVSLTPKGVQVINAASVARFAEAKESINHLSAQERSSLAELLREMSIELEKK